MRKLFLASYFTKVATMFPDFINDDCMGKTVVFIPTAALHEKDTFYIDTDRSALQSLGFVVEDLEISNTPFAIINKKISVADCIFVGGGNTFFLLQELKRTGTDKLIIEHIAKGKPYISTSAGSCILSKKVIADGIDSPKIASNLNGDFSALAIIDFYIFPHYDISSKSIDDQIISTYYSGLDIKRINDNQAVSVHGKDVRVISLSEIIKKS